MTKLKKNGEKGASMTNELLSLFVLGIMVFGLWVVLNAASHEYLVECTGDGGKVVTAIIPALSEDDVRPVAVCRDQMLNPTSYRVMLIR